MKIEIDDSDWLGNMFFNDLSFYEILQNKFSEIIQRDGGFNDENSAELDSIYSKQKILMPRIVDFLVAKLRCERERIDQASSGETGVKHVSGVFHNSAARQW